MPTIYLCYEALKLIDTERILLHLSGTLFGNASGKASSKFAPRRAEHVTVNPLVPGGVKSGAISPTFKIADIGYLLPAAWVARTDAKSAQTAEAKLSTPARRLS